MNSEKNQATKQFDTNKPLNPECGTNIWLPNYESTNDQRMTQKVGEMASNAKEAISDQFRDLKESFDKTSATKDLSNNSENFHATKQLDTDKMLNPENGTNVWLPNYENTSNKGITEKASEMFSNTKESVSNQLKNISGSSVRPTTGDLSNNAENFHATTQSDTNKPLNPESGTNIWLPNYENANDRGMATKVGGMVSNTKEVISDQFRNLTGNSDKLSTVKDSPNKSENFHATTQMDTDKPLNPETGTNIWLPNYESTNDRGMSEKVGKVISNTREAISDQFRDLTGSSDKTSTAKVLPNKSENFNATTQLDTDKPLNPESGTNIWLPNYESTTNKGIIEKAGEMFSNVKGAVSDQFRNLTGNSDKNSTNLSNNPENVVHGTVQSETNKPLNPENGTNIWLPNYENTDNKRITERAGEIISNVKENISNQWKNLTETSDQSITVPSQNLSNNAENLQGGMRQSDTNKPLNPENGTNVWLPNYEKSSN